MTNPARKLPVTLSTHTDDPANDTHGAPVFLLPALPLDGSITLATLAALFPTADAGCRTIHLRNYSEADLVDEGNKVATPRILDAVPRLLVSVLRALAHALDATRTTATAAPPPRAVTQRELDHQDGVVLVLLDALVDGMLEAHRASPTIEKPDFATLTKRYRSRSGKRPAKTEPNDEGSPKPE